ncbi:unnamed protein product [Amoebophrya sp. A120]|nr:unnamed protein product [Amoebophrya sp. A120]|eukprot:GSA120T00010121001.1
MSRELLSVKNTSFHHTDEEPSEINQGLLIFVQEVDLE